MCARIAETDERLAALIWRQPDSDAGNSGSHHSRPTGFAPSAERRCSNTFIASPPSFPRRNGPTTSRSSCPRCCVPERWRNRICASSLSGAGAECIPFLLDRNIRGFDVAPSRRSRYCLNVPAAGRRRPCLERNHGPMAEAIDQFPDQADRKRGDRHRPRAGGVRSGLSKPRPLPSDGRRSQPGSLRSLPTSPGTISAGNSGIPPSRIDAPVGSAPHAISETLPGSDPDPRTRLETRRESRGRPRCHCGDFPPIFAKR